MENVNVSELMKMLSKMDKKELEEGLTKASQILNSPKSDTIINEIKKKEDL